MKNSDFGHIVEVVSELALREFKREELSSSGYSRREFYLKYLTLVRKNYIRIFWSKLNQLATYSYGCQCFNDSVHISGCFQWSEFLLSSRKSKRILWILVKHLDHTQYN